MSIFYLPDLGEGLTEAEIRTWYVKEGDMVSIDQPLVSLETAKALVDIPSPVAGKIIQRFGKENEIVATGAPLIEFELSDATLGNLALAPKKHSVVGSLEESSNRWEEDAPSIAATKTSSALKALPAARALAEAHGIDLKNVPPSASGFITKNDVERYISTTQTSIETKSNAQTETLRGVKRVMAIAMKESHQHIVPVTILDDIELTQLPEHFDISVALIQSIVTACKEEPSLNAWFDDSILEKKLFSDVHLGMAVDTQEGLFVPVIKNAQSLTPGQLRNSIDHYKQAAQERSFSSADLQGATITLSNFGSIAAKYANPIVTPPMVSIVGVGKLRPAPIVIQGKVEAGFVLPISITFDHRAVTGGEATRFLSALMKHFLLCLKEKS